MREFADKTVVITGGATGIGLSLAKQFGKEGANVVIGGLRADRLQQAEAELASLGVNARHLVCDVTRYGDVEALADFAWGALGHVDVLINNAGIVDPPRAAIETPIDEVRRIFDVNLYGVWHCISVFGKRFIAQRTPAAIYNVGSENALFVALPMSASYVASKHAVLGLTEALREEVPDFIDVGLICPGFVRSEAGDPETMAMGMDTDRYTDLVMKQIKQREFFIVSHAYNKVRIQARHDEIVSAYDTYAPRYEGDTEFDVRTLQDRARP